MTSVEGIARALGCSETLQPRYADEVRSGVEHEGVCTIGNVGITISDFGTEKNLKDWREMNSQIGFSEEQGVMVGLVFVEPSNADLVDQIRATLLEGAPPPTVAAQEAPSTTETTSERPEPDVSPYAADPDDWQVRLKVTEKECFGSTGCVLTVEPKVTYIGSGEAPSRGTVDITFEIRGDEDGERIETVPVELSSGLSSDSPILVNTTGPSVKPEGKVVDVEWDQ